MLGPGLFFLGGCPPYLLIRYTDRINTLININKLHCYIMFTMLYRVTLKSKRAKKGPIGP